MKKICPKCGKAFECRKSNCWCAKIKVNKKTLNDIKKYKDCLCKECLTEY